MCSCGVAHSVNRKGSARSTNTSRSVVAIPPAPFILMQKQRRHRVQETCAPLSTASARVGSTKQGTGPHAHPRISVCSHDCRVQFFVCLTWPFRIHYGSEIAVCLFVCYIYLWKFLLHYHSQNIMHSMPRTIHTIITCVTW